MPKEPRSPSCLPCRLKKLKCDKKTPCTRCTKTNSNHCVYPRQGSLGRPPKNAVFLGKIKNNGLNELMIREFIFEPGSVIKNNNNSALVAANKANTDTGLFVVTEWWILSKEAVKNQPFLYTYFKSLDNLYTERGLAIRKRFGSESSRLPEKPRIKFNNLKFNYTWWTCMTINLLIKRASQLQMETHSLPFLVLNILQMDNNVRQDANHNYFDCHSKHGKGLESDITTLSKTNTLTTLEYQPDTPNPLRSLPPDQAINLINDFFLVHPHSILINKTKLVEQYWSDTANPLLLSVIYGTTQCLSKNMQGVPIFLWESGVESNRNPFLAYAHFLLESLPSSPSTSDYQATVILGLFEALWGYPKRGMSLLATTYVIGTKLGLWDKSFKPDDSIDAELVNMTFWAVFRSTTYGAIELGASLLDSLVYHEQLLPPMNMNESQSYQHDLLHGSVNDTGYLIESFYTGAVVTLFSGIIYACLPKAYFTLYGLKTDDATFEGSELLTRLRSINDVETRIFTVLDDLDQFIQQHKNRWTAIQLYTIETTLKLYRIHFRFLQPTLASGRRKYQEEPISSVKGDQPTSNPLTSFDLDLTDPDIAFRIRCVRNDIFAIVDDLETILVTHSNNDDPQSINAATFLPHDVMIAVFETATQLLILSYRLNPSKQLFDTIKKLTTLSDLHDLHIIPSAALKNVRHWLKCFLKRQDPTTVTTRRTPGTNRSKHGNPTCSDLDNPGVVFLYPCETMPTYSQSSMNVGMNAYPVQTLPTHIDINQRYETTRTPVRPPSLLQIPPFIDSYPHINTLPTFVEPMPIGVPLNLPTATEWEGSGFSEWEWNSWMALPYDAPAPFLTQDPPI